MRIPPFGLLSASVTPERNNGVHSITINDLNPNHQYWFTVIPVNGCAAGTWSNWLKADSENGKDESIFYQYLPVIINS